MISQPAGEWTLPAAWLSNSLGVITMAIFTNTLKSVWLILLATAVAFELMPMHYPAGVLTLHNCYKACLLLLLGYLLPLAFWQYNTLNTSLLLAALSVPILETLQAAIGNGHRFSLLEVTAKSLLLAIGFVVALNTRYEMQITVGRLRLRLTVPTHRATRHHRLMRFRH
jgi:hypothetical protein